ncbi:MAG: hypothetical protein SFY96_12590 [Planctomycetota bacterium]|nr:hypothetical protein [Planctomycetota bacterium]
MAVSNVVVVRVVGVNWAMENSVKVGPVNGVVVGQEVVDGCAVTVVAVDEDCDVSVLDVVGSKVPVCVNNACVGTVVVSVPVVNGVVVTQFVADQVDSVTGVGGNSVQNGQVSPGKMNRPERASPSGVNGAGL